VLQGRGLGVTALEIDPQLAVVLRERGVREVREGTVADLADPTALDHALAGATVVLHCAGPFAATAAPMVAACLRRRVHYLDITGELPVFDAIAARDQAARDRGVMLLPGAGFDVVPTDCLALHLQAQLPDATRLRLAFRSRGPAGLPPGTQRTAIELLPLGRLRRRDGELERWRFPPPTPRIDFGDGPTPATPFTWGDLVTAHHSTGIPNIEVFVGLPAAARRLLAVSDALRPLWRLAAVRRALATRVQPGASAAALAATHVDVWGEVENAAGERVSARLHGPEAGVVWTARAAVAAAARVLAGDAPVGYQTPGGAFGADFVLESEGVAREDLPRAR
jgi:short subunit dehydrogenase-like uncharacterized protein